MPEQADIISSAVEKEEIKIPRATHLFEVEEVLRGKDPSKLYLRWSPDILADSKPGTISRNLGHGTPEAGISAHPLNPFPEAGYGLDQTYRLEGNDSERKYYLLSGEVVLDQDGNPVHGDDGEPVLQPESIHPLMEISPGVTDEAYFRRLALDTVEYPKKPGDSMRQIKEKLASWTLHRESAENLRQKTIEGIDKYLTTSS